MRPQSIRKFDLYYLGSLAVSAIAFILSYDTVVAQVEAQAAASGLQMGAGAAIASFAIGMAISLLLWFLVSRKRIAIAKWIIVLFFVIGLIGLPGLFSGDLTVVEMLSLASTVLSAVAIYYLFQPDTAAWLAGDESADPAQGD